MDELQKYYEYLRKAKADVPDTYESFRNTMQDSASSRKYYEYLRANQFDTPDNYDSFVNTFGLKKKEPSKAASLFGGMAGTSVPQSGGVMPPVIKTKIQETVEKGKEKDESSITEYLYNLKTPEQKQQSKLTPEVAQKRAYDLGQDRLSEYMGKGSADPLKDIKTAANNKKDAEDIVKDFMAAKTLDDFTPGSTANQLLVEDKFSGDTKELLQRKAGKYNTIAQPFRELGQINYSDQRDFGTRGRIYDAAIKAYANKNPLFAKQLEAAGADLKNGSDFYLQLEDKTGQVVNEILGDEDFTDYLKNENPDLYNSVKLVADNILTDNKAFGANVVANEISRERQKSGYNNPIVEFDDRYFRRENDLVAERLYANDPQKMQIYKEIISQNPDKYIDTPNLIESVAHGAKGVYQGIGNTFSAPFKTTSQQIKDVWRKEANNVSADPDGINKFMSGTGHVLGFVVALGGIGNVIGAGGAGLYSSKVAPTLSGTIPFVGDFYQEGVAKYPDSPVKAATSTALNTILYGALSQRIFPAKQVKEAFSKIKPEIGKVVESLAAGNITKEAARRKAQSLIKDGIELLGGGMAKSAKISAELSAITAANRGLDKLMMGKNEFSQFHPDEEIEDTFKSLFLDNLVLGGMTKYSSMKRGNRIVEEGIYEAASNPLRYERVINEMEVKDPTISKENMLANLRHVSETKKALDDAGIPEKSQKRYLFESLRVRTLKEEAAKLPEANLTRRAEAEIKRGEEVAQGILDGKDPDTIVTTEEQKKVDEKAKTDAARNKSIEKGQNAVQKLLDEKVKEGETEKNKLQGIYRDIAKSDPVGFLQEIADQVFGMERQEGERVKSKSAAPNESEMIKKYGADVINAAKELFPLEPEKPKIEQQREIDLGTEPVSEPPSISVQMPGEVKKPQTTEIKPAEAKSSEVLNNLSKSDRETGTIALFESGLSLEEGEQLVEDIKNGNVTVNNLHTRLNVPTNTLFFAKKLLTEGKLADALREAIEIKKSQKETVIDIEEQNKKSITINEKFINELKQKRDSEDFKYIIVEESDVLGNRKKVKRLKTKQELEESTKKINDAINKAEKENEKLKLQLKEQPKPAETKPAEPIEEDMTAFVEVTRPELGFEELPTDILDNMDSKTMAVQGKRLEGLNKNLEKLKELFECIWS